MFDYSNSMFSDLVQSYYNSPVHNKPPVEVTVSRHEWNSVCGDHIKVYLMIQDTIITDRGFDGDTSLITTAAAGFFGDLVIWQRIDAVLTWSEQTMIDEGFEVSSRRRRARVIALMATQNAIHQYQKTDRVVSFEEFLG